MNKNPNFQYVEKALIKILMNRFSAFLPQDDLRKIKECLSMLNFSYDLIEDTCLFELIEEGTGRFPSPLRSIFSQLSLSHEKPIPSYYAPMPLHEPFMTPSEVPPSLNTLENYWKTITKEFCRFWSNCPDDAQVRISYFLYWADQWLSNIPVGSKKESVPLSVYIRLVASIASVIQKGEHLTLLMGDISGIQRYLFDISRIGGGSVAKLLRARSFSLGLIADAAAYDLLERLGLPVWNLVLSAGGVFYLLAPKGIDTFIEQWKKEINQHLYEKYHGTIVLHTSKTEVSLHQLENDFPSCLTNLFQQIRKSKSRSFEEILIRDGKWNEDAFIHNVSITEEFCKSCRRYPADAENEEKLCRYCQEDEKIGKLIPKTKYIVFHQKNGDISIFPNVSVSLIQAEEHIPTDSKLIVIINQHPIPKKEVPIQQRWMTNYIPTAPKGGCNHCKEQGLFTEEGIPLSFNCLASLAKGKERIAYLKADVDRLGMLFSFGLRNKDERGLYTLDEIMTLSRYLERFFAGHVNEMIEKKYRNIYTVFSGGDDLFLIGSWNEVIEFAKEIHQQFVTYVGGNTDVTLSAGIEIVRSRIPLPHATKMVEEQLELAKENPSYNRKLEGRNQIAIRHKPVEWGDFEKILSEAERLGKWCLKGWISSSFLHKLYYFANMYQSLQKGQGSAFKLVPLLNDQIQRNITGTFENERQEIGNWFSQLLQIDVAEVRWKWAHMKLILEVAQLYREREEKDSYGNQNIS
jgi:CRISPR-associated protein Csm1